MRRKLFFLSALIIFLVCIFGLGNSVYAKSYRIRKAEFDVHFLEDGDVRIEEEWTIFYDGSYSRFYKI